MFCSSYLVALIYLVGSNTVGYAVGDMTVSEPAGVSGQQTIM